MGLIAALIAFLLIASSGTTSTMPTPGDPRCFEVKAFGQTYYLTRGELTAAVKKYVVPGSFDEQAWWETIDSLDVGQTYERPGTGVFVTRRAPEACD